MSLKEKTMDEVLIKVPDNETISLRIKIGNANWGANKALFTDDQIILAKGDIDKNLPLGKGRDIKGRILQIVSVIQDVNPSTNKINVTHIFENGAAKETLIMGNVDAERDVLRITATYRFI